MDKVDLQNKAITGNILRKIVKKMEYRSQAVLSFCSQFGKAAYDSHGADLHFVKGFCDGASFDHITGPNGSQLLFVTDVFHRGSCPENLHDGDQVVVFNGREAATMTTTEVHEGVMPNPEVIAPPLMILRRPRECEKMTVTCEYPLEREGELVNFGFIFYEYAVIRNRFLLALVADDGPAARAGLQEGDEVVEINGHQPVAHLHATRVLLALQPILRLTVKRSGF